MKSFVTKLTILSLILALAGWLVFSLLIPQYYIPILPFLLIFFYATTLGVHTYQVGLSKKDMAKFTRSNMLVTFFKLMVYSTSAILYIAIDKENAIPFVVCLMILYLVFTYVEVSEITKHTGAKKE